MGKLLQQCWCQVFLSPRYFLKDTNNFIQYEEPQVELSDFLRQHVTRPLQVLLAFFCLAPNFEASLRSLRSS